MATGRTPQGKRILRVHVSIIVPVRKKEWYALPYANHLPQRVLPDIEQKAIWRDIITLTAFALDFAAKVR